MIEYRETPDPKNPSYVAKPCKPRRVIDVHVATPNGISNHLLVEIPPAAPGGDQKDPPTITTTVTTTTKSNVTDGTTQTMTEYKTNPPGIVLPPGTYLPMGGNLPAGGSVVAPGAETTNYVQPGFLPGTVPNTTYTAPKQGETVGAGAGTVPQKPNPQRNDPLKEGMPTQPRIRHAQPDAELSRPVPAPPGIPVPPGVSDAVEPAKNAPKLDPANDEEPPRPASPAAANLAPRENRLTMPVPIWAAKPWDANVSRTSTRALPAGRKSPGGAQKPKQAESAPAKTGPASARTTAQPRRSIISRIFDREP